MLLMSYIYEYNVKGGGGDFSVRSLRGGGKYFGAPLSMGQGKISVCRNLKIPPPHPLVAVNNDRSPSVNKCKNGKMC